MPLSVLDESLVFMLRMLVSALSQGCHLKAWAVQWHAQAEHRTHRANITELLLELEAGTIALASRAQEDALLAPLICATLVFETMVSAIFLTLKDGATWRASQEGTVALPESCRHPHDSV